MDPSDQAASASEQAASGPVDIEAAFSNALKMIVNLGHTEAEVIGFVQRLSDKGLDDAADNAVERQVAGLFKPRNHRSIERLIREFLTK